MRDDTWLLILLLSLLGAAFVVRCVIALAEYLIDRATIVPPPASWVPAPGVGEQRVWPVAVRAPRPAVTP